MKWYKNQRRLTNNKLRIINKPKINMIKVKVYKINNTIIKNNNY